MEEAESGVRPRQLSLHPNEVALRYAPQFPPFPQPEKNADQSQRSEKAMKALTAWVAALLVCLLFLKPDCPLAEKRTCREV